MRSEAEIRKLMQIYYERGAFYGGEVQTEFWHKADVLKEILQEKDGE